MFQKNKGQPAYKTTSRASLPDDQSRSKSGSDWRVVAALSALLGFASISTDFYLPAMPAMAASLGADIGVIEYTITTYLVGFCLGQLVWGPVSDRYGRRVPIAIGLFLFIMGSAGCALADNSGELILWRIAQAFGAAAGVVLGRAMVRDLYRGERAAQMLSTLIAIMGIAPLIAPLIGGHIAAFAGWRAIFWLLTLIGGAVLASLFILPETLPPDRRRKGSISQVATGYLFLLRQRRLLAYIGAGGFFYAGAFAYIAGSPFAFIVYHHVPVERYGLLFGAGVLGIMLANFVNTRLVRLLDRDRRLILGALIAALSGVFTAIAAYFDLGGLWGLFPPLFIFMSCNGFIVANSIAGALDDFPEQAGAVSALVGSLQYGSGIFGSALVGYFADGTPWPMGWVIALCGAGCLICATRSQKPAQ